MILSDYDHAGPYARPRGNWGTPKTSGRAALECLLAGRPAPRLRTRRPGRVRDYGSPDLRSPENFRSCVARRALLLELEEPVLVAIDEGHQAGLDDVRRGADGPPAEFAGCRLDQHPCDGFR